MELKFWLSVVVVVCCSAALGMSEEQTNSSSSSPLGMRSLLRIYDECHKADGGLSMCIKKKAVTFIDRISRIDTINIGEGIKVIGLEDATGIADAGKPKSLTENELDQMLPRGIEDRDYFLTNMLADKIASYISGRNIQISLPKITSSDIGRGMEEGEPYWGKLLFDIYFICFGNRWESSK